MNSRTIMYAMGDAWTSKQLEIALRPYIDKITYEEVCNFVLDGVYDFKEKIVAFVLGLNKYFPKGWIPHKIKIKYKSNKYRREAINRDWMDHEKKALCLMVQSGLNNKEISREIQRTEGAVTMAICKWCPR